MPAHPQPSATAESHSDRVLPAGPLLRRVPAYEPALHQPHHVATAFPPPLRRTPAAPAPAPPRPEPVIPAALERTHQVFKVIFEVVEGRRGPNQLGLLMTPGLVAKVTTLARDYAGQRRRSTARLHRVHVQQVTPRVAEACVSVERGRRVHAVAARLELGRSGWMCTALTLG